jgi:hypothetical protein
MFLIETSPDSKYILNKNSRNILGLKFDRNLMEILIGTSGFDEIWLKGSCLHLDDKSTHENEFEVSN